MTYIYGMFYRFGLIDVPDDAKEEDGSPEKMQKIGCYVQKSTVRCAVNLNNPGSVSYCPDSPHQEYSFWFFCCIVLLKVCERCLKEL